MARKLIPALLLLLVASSAAPTSCSCKQTDDITIADTASDQVEPTICGPISDENDEQSKQLDTGLLTGSCRQASKQQTNESSLGCANNDATNSNLLPTIDSLLDPRKLNSASWRLNYFHEQTDRFEVLIQEKSLDERLANVVFTVSTNRIGDQDIFDYNSGDPELDSANKLIGIGSQVNQEKCSQHLNGMLDLMNELATKLESKRKNRSNEPLNLREQHYRLAKVLDSFGRYGSGHLIGRTNLPGSFSGCSGSELMIKVANGSEFERVKSRLCWARLNIDKHLNNDLKILELNEFSQRKRSIQTAICIPESCHSISFDANRKQFEQLVHSQFKLPSSIYLDENLELESIACSADPDSAFKIPFNGRLLLTSLAVWFVLIAIATHLINSRTSGSAIKGKETLQKHSNWLIDRYRPTLECLDLRRLIDEFLCQDVGSYKSDSSKVNLNLMNPVKVLGCLFVTFGHSIILHHGNPSNLLKAMKSDETDPVLFGSIFGTLIVDTFFVITGILFAFVTMRKAGKQKQRVKPTETGANVESSPGNGRPIGRRTSDNQLRLFLRQWIKFTTTRALRLLPLYYIVFWFKKSVFFYLFVDYTSTWDEGYNRDTLSGSCRQESWFSPLMFGSAFLPLNRQCLPQAWSVASDLFFSLTIAPLLLIMTKKPKLAFTLATLVTIISTTVAYYYYSMHDYDPALTAQLKALSPIGFVVMFGGLSHFYTNPFYRFSSILTGMLAGYVLFKYEQNEEMKWPQWLKGWATKVSIGTLVISLLASMAVGPIKQLLGRESLPFVVDHLVSTYRIIFAVCNAIVLIRLASDWKDNYLVKLGGGKFWQVMTKINFAILLVHMDFLYFDLYVHQPDEYNRIGIYTSFAGAYLFCLPLGCLIYLLIESPIHRLIKLHVMPTIQAL